MGKIERSRTIFKKSFALLMKEKKLLVFPVISCLAMAVLIVLICGGSIGYIVFSPNEVISGNGNDPQTTVSTAESALLVVTYFLVMFVSNFCSTAFFSEIFIGLHGGSTSVNRGFHTAMKRMKALLLWTLLASTVGILLKGMENKSGAVGKIVFKFIGAAWAVVSCFSIPAIALDPELVNPFTVLKKSAVSIRKTWGESLIGFAGLGILYWLALLVGLPLLLAGFMLIATGDSSACTSAFAGTVLICATILVLLVLYYLLSAVQTVYRAAMYLYADGEDAGMFTEEELQSAFFRKNE